MDNELTKKPLRKRMQVEKASYIVIIHHTLGSHQLFYTHLSNLYVNGLITYSVDYTELYSIHYKQWQPCQYHIGGYIIIIRGERVPQTISFTMVQESVA